MSIIKKFFSLIFVLLFAVGLFLYLNFGDLAKRAAEKIATNALGVEVNISSLDILLKEKRAVLRGLTIANPPGYKKSHIITAEQLNIALNTASKQLIDFKQVSVDGVVVNLEVNEKGVNLRDLKNLAAQKKQKESVGSEQVRVIVRNMVVNTSTLNPSVSFMGKDIASVEVPAVRISGIGSTNGGVIARDAVSQVLIQYIAAAERESGQAGFLSSGNIPKDLEGAVDNAVQDIKKLFD